MEIENNIDREAAGKTEGNQLVSECGLSRRFRADGEDLSFRWEAVSWNKITIKSAIQSTFNRNYSIDSQRIPGLPLFILNVKLFSKCDCY